MGRLDHLRFDLIHLSLLPHLRTLRFTLVRQSECYCAASQVMSFLGRVPYASPPYLETISLEILVDNLSAFMLDWDAWREFDRMLMTPRFGMLRVVEVEISGDAVDDAVAGFRHVCWEACERGLMWINGRSGVDIECCCAREDVWEDEPDYVEASLVETLFA